MSVIDTLTIGDAKQLAGMFGTAPRSDGYAEFIGKAVLVRSRNEGVNFGIVVSADAEAITLKDARRIWYHRPSDKSQSWYEGVANSGLSGDSKISAPVTLKRIVEDYSITLCSDTAAQNIKEFKTHAQS